MKHHLRTLLSAALFALAATALTAGDSPAPANPPTETSAKEAYPLTTCVVSGEPLEGGDMGGPVDYIHKEPGQPDRLVRFCCRACLKDFKKDPAKYLAKIDAAAQARASTPQRRE